MPQQLGEGGGRMLGRWVDSLGVDLHCGVAPDQFLADASGNVTGLQMADGTIHDCDIVVFSAGVRPRDEVARRSGIDVGERGGIVVDDTLQTSVEHVWAIGEVALHEGRVYGLVAPGLRDGGRSRRRGSVGGDDALPGERPVDEAQAARRRRGDVRPEQCDPATAWTNSSTTTRSTRSSGGSRSTPPPAR